MALTLSLSICVLPLLFLPERDPYSPSANVGVEGPVKPSPCKNRTQPGDEDLRGSTGTTELSALNEMLSYSIVRDIPMVPSRCRPCVPLKRAECHKASNFRARDVHLDYQSHFGATNTSVASCVVVPLMLPHSSTHIVSCGKNCPANRLYRRYVGYLHQLTPDHTKQLTFLVVIHSVKNVLEQKSRLSAKGGAKMSPKLIHFSLGTPDAKPALTAKRAWLSQNSCSAAKLGCRTYRNRLDVMKPGCDSRG